MKKRGRMHMMESTQMCPEVSQFCLNYTTLELFKSSQQTVILRCKIAFKLNHWNSLKWPNQSPYDTIVQSRVIFT